MSHAALIAILFIVARGIFPGIFSSCCTLLIILLEGRGVCLFQSSQYHNF
jgi:hypothetical protein